MKSQPPFQLAKIEALRVPIKKRKIVGATITCNAAQINGLTVTRHFLNFRHKQCFKQAQDFKIARQGWLN